MTVKLENASDNTLNIAFNGRIDSSNATEVEAQILALLDGHAVEKVVFDGKHLEYISSAGLRIFLRLRKSFPEIRITDVSNDVYDIFEMTGFTEMLEIERAYRTMSVEGCEKIGEGANGIVYRTDPETIVKVYKSTSSLDEIRNEREVARKALILGIPTAISYDIVRVGDSFASVFELIDAKSFSQIIASEPGRIDELIDLSVDLLKQLHSTELSKGELPDHRANALLWLEDVRGILPSGLEERLSGLMERIPESYCLIHGDFHTKNLMLQKDGPIIIDMDTLSLGNPVFEFAPIYLAYKGYGELDRNRITDFIGLDWDTAQHFRTEILRRYLGNPDEDTLMVSERKIEVVAYLKMLRHFVRKESGDKELIQLCIDRLSELVPQVESLSF